MTNEVLQYLMALNGSLLLLVGLLGGFPYAKAIVRGRPTEGAWRLFHSATCLGAVMLLAEAAVCRLLDANPWQYATLLILSLSAVYAFALGMLVAAITGARGLDRQAKGPGRWVHALYVVGTVTSLMAVCWLIWLLSASFFAR